MQARFDFLSEKLGRSAGQVPPGHREDRYPHVTEMVPRRSKPPQSSENCRGLWRVIKHNLIRRMSQFYSGYGGSQTAYD